MTTSDWFDDVPVVGKMPPAAAAAKLREVGETDLADALEGSAAETVYEAQVMGDKGTSPWRAVNRLFAPRPWQHTAHTFGYLAPAPPGSDPLPIQQAGNITADESLKGARIKITLDCLRVADYPGWGIHHVLFDFYAQNQVPGGMEHLHFNASYRVHEGEQAAIVGYPIFVGLNTGTEGVSFKCFTVNVSNDDDETMLGFLDSDVFKGGLYLVDAVQPAIAPFSEMAFGLTRAIAARNRNVPVQDFYMGLDYSTIPMRARLAEGSYLAVQIPQKLQTVWDWRDWVYNPHTGQVVEKTNHRKLVPFNYIAFSVTRYEGEG